MKKITFILVALLLVGVAFQAQAATPGDRKSPGIGVNEGNLSGGYQDTPVKYFRLCRSVASDGTTDKGSAVRWSLSQDDGVTISLTGTSADSAIAGILVQDCLSQETSGNTAAQDRGKRNWSWLQTHGYCNVARLENNTKVNAGDAWGTATQVGRVTGYQGPAVGSGGEGRALGIGGFFFDDSGTVPGTDADVIEIFIRCE